MQVGVDSALAQLLKARPPGPQRELQQPEQQRGKRGLIDQSKL